MLCTYKDVDEAVNVVRVAKLWGLPFSSWMKGRPAGRTGPPILGGSKLTRRWEDVAGNQLQLRAADATEEVFELKYLATPGYGKPSLDSRSTEDQHEIAAESSMPAQLSCDETSGNVAEGRPNAESSPAASHLRTTADSAEEESAVVEQESAVVEQDNNTLPQSSRVLEHQHEEGRALKSRKISLGGIGTQVSGSPYSDSYPLHKELMPSVHHSIYMQLVDVDAAIIFEKELQGGPKHSWEAELNKLASLSDRRLQVT